MKYSSLLCPALMLLLAACGSQSPDKQPQKATAGATYQVSFSIAGERQASASIRTATGQSVAGIGAQGLQNAPEGLTFSSPIAVQTYLTRKTGEEIRHVQATFTVTNNTTQTLTRLSFLPVIRTDADNDPGNNPLPATIPGTPFLNVQHYDGSDASALASNMRLNQGGRIDVSSGEEMLDPLASPYMSGLDVTGLSVAAPTGMTTTVMNSGWLAADSLAPGDSTNVTMAIELPVDRNLPSTQPYRFDLLITSAEDLNGSGLANTLNANVISGNIEGWTLGAGKSLSYWITSRQDLANPPYLGDISPGGQVNAILPTPPLTALQRFIPYDYEFVGEHSIDNFNYFSPDLSVITSGRDTLGRINENTLSGMHIVRIYADKSGYFNGYLHADSIYPIADTNFYNIHVKAGWNVFGMTVSTNTQGQNIILISDLPAGSRSRITFSKAPESLVADFPNGENLIPIELLAGQSMPVSINFYQYGGISGEISLEVNVPGVSVSPDRITLPEILLASLSSGLSTHTLTSQSLATTLTLTAAPDAPAYNGQALLIMRKNDEEVGSEVLAHFIIIRPTVRAGVLPPFTSTNSQSILPLGGSVSVPVNVSSLDGFSGTTTLTFENLPAGITASTESVTLVAGESKIINITVTASPQATLGFVMANLTGPDYNTDPIYTTGMTQSLYMTVVP